MRRLLRKIRTASRLTPADRARVGITFVLMAAARIAIWTTPFLWLKGVVEKSRTREFIRSRFADEGQVARAVRLVSRYVPRATCLTQAVTAQILLSGAGIESQLHIGVRLEKKFEAHAWVECSGRVLVGGAAESARFTRMLTIDRARYPEHR